MKQCQMNLFLNEVATESKSTIGQEMLVQIYWIKIGASQIVSTLTKVVKEHFF